MLHIKLLPVVSKEYIFFIYLFFSFNQKLPHKTKVDDVKKIAVPILTYGSESWQKHGECGINEFLEKNRKKNTQRKIPISTFKDVFQSKPILKAVGEVQHRRLVHM